VGIVDLVRIIRRNIVALIVLLVATAAAIGVVWQTAPVPYQSEASMVVLPPNVGFDLEDDTFPVNPWRNLGDPSLEVAANALVSVADDKVFTGELTDRGVTSMTDAEVALDAAGLPLGGVGVFVTLTAINDDPDAARSDLVILRDQLAEELQVLQLEAGAPESTLITIVELTTPTEPEPLVIDRLTLSGVVGGMGLIVTVLLAALLEALHRRRKRLASSNDADADADADAGANADATTTVAFPARSAAAPSASRHGTGSHSQTRPAGGRPGPHPEVAAGRTGGKPRPYPEVAAGRTGGKSPPQPEAPALRTKP